MATVTQIVKITKQPYGGYLPVKNFNVINLKDDNVLCENENIHPSLVGLVVDYLTRFKLSNSAVNAFNISLMGARNILMFDKAQKLIDQVKDLDSNSVVAACKLVGFDVCYRKSISDYVPIETINPDEDTINNIIIMVKRSLKFFEQFGPIICFEPTFEGGYSAKVDKGDGDFVTEDTLWDFKVTKSKITSKHTLKLLMYYIMGIHSNHEFYKKIKNIGFYNPRLNIVFLCAINKIPSDIIKMIENDVIEYNNLSSNITKTNIERKCNQFNDFTVQELHEITNVSKSKIYQCIRNGIILAYKKGNKYYVKPEEVDKFVKSLKKISIIKCIGFGVMILFITTVLIFIFISYSA